MITVFKVLTFGLAVLLGAAAQDVCQMGSGGVDVHVPFLLAFSVYAAAARRALSAMVAALSIGLLTDVLAQLPLACTLSLNLLVWLGLMALKRMTSQTLATIVGGALLCGVLAPVQVVWSWLWMEAQAGWLCWARLGWAVAAGVIAGVAVFTAGVVGDPLRRRARETTLSEEDEHAFDA